MEGRPAFWAGLNTLRAASLKAGLALAVFCLVAALLLSVMAVASARALQQQLDREFALTAAQQRLATGLADDDPARVEETLAALLRQGDYGFRYLAVRDNRGSVLAASGRWESLNRNALLPSALRAWLRAQLYTRFGESGVLTLREGERTLGSVEYAIGSGSSRLVRDEAVDRLRTTGFAGGTLALLFGSAVLLLLRSALAAGAAPLAARAEARSAAGESAIPVPAAVADPLPAAFDALDIGLMDIDAELRVTRLNATASRLTGWTAEAAAGQLVYTVFHARDEAGAPIVSPIEHCARDGRAQPAAELRLRPRAGAGSEAVVEARTVALAGGGARMWFADVAPRIQQRESLRAQAELAEGVVDHLLEAVLTTDSAGVVKTANQRAQRMFGYTAEQMARLTVARLLPVPFMNTPGLKLTDYLPGSAARLPKLAGWRKDATTFPAELVVEPMRVAGEERLVVIIRDITERTRSMSLAQRLGRLLDAATDEVYIFDAQSLYFTEVNKGARKNLGLKPDQLARMTLATIATDLEPAMLQGYLARLRGGEAEQVSYKTNHRRGDGSTYPVEVRLSFSREEEPPVFMAIAQDITEREAAEKRMRQLAHFDTLTGLPNRTLLFDRLKQAMHVAARSGRQLAVVFMDLDGFKPVNDAYGHEAGDSVLQTVADRLNASLRAADTVARFGGDEFVVLAHSIRDAEDATTLAAKIHECFRTPFEAHGERVMLSTSIGITLYPNDASDAEGLLRHADAAMYEAKQEGKGRTRLFAAASLPERVGEKPKPQRADLAREIHAGIATRQFQLLLQPVFGAGSEVTGLVADFYWAHPEFGRVDARDTLQAARRAGLNAEIEHWLLREAVAYQRTSREQGQVPLPVLLPLTGRQWRDPEFPDRLQNLVELAGVPLPLVVPLIEGSDWPDAHGSIQMLWPLLLQGGLRIAVRAPEPGQPLDGAALVTLPVGATGVPDEPQLAATLRQQGELERPVLFEQVASSKQWDRLRRLGAQHGTGSALQAALTPLELAAWAGGRVVRPL